MKTSWMGTKQDGKRPQASTVPHEYSGLCRQFFRRKIFFSAQVNQKRKHSRRSTALPGAASGSFLPVFWQRFARPGPAAESSSGGRSKGFLRSPLNGATAITRLALA